MATRVSPLASEQEIEEVRAKILEDPRGWIAQPVLQLSTVPTFDGEGFSEDLGAHLLDLLLAGQRADHDPLAARAVDGLDHELRPPSTARASRPGTWTCARSA
jgi:hypothetical protein